jgi:hypothetical protein
MSVVAPTGRGRWGKAALVAQVCFLGLLWAWVANNTRSILWTAVAHILIDFSAASMGCPFHRTLFERGSADCLRRCHGRGNRLTPPAWYHCPFAFMGLGLLVRVTRLSLLAILVAAERDYQDDMSLRWLGHSLESLADRRAPG